MRILIIENDQALTSKLVAPIQEVGYQVDVVENLEDGLYYADLRNYGAILLANSLFKTSDSNIIKTLKASQEKPVTVLVLASQNNGSVVDSEADDNEIATLKAGANAYVRNASNLALVLVHIEAHLDKAIPNIISIENLVVNTAEATVTYNDRPIQLNENIIEVLAYLASHANKFVSKEVLLEAVWREPELVTPSVVDVAISEIRKKIEKPFGITLIERAGHRGYRFCFEGEIS